MNYFAWLDCQGFSECSVLTVYMLFYMSIPIIVVGLLILLVTNLLVAAANKKKSTPYVGKKSFFIKAAIFIVITLIAVFIWEFPKSEYWQNRNMQKAINTFKEEASILLPQEGTIKSSSLYVGKYDPTDFEIITRIEDKQRLLQVSQDTDDIPLITKDNECKRGKINEIEYCEYNHPYSNPAFLVDHPNGHLEIEFSSGFSHEEAIEIIKNLELKRVKDIENITVRDRSKAPAEGRL